MLMLFSSCLCTTPNEDVLDPRKLPDKFHTLLSKLRHDFDRAARCEHKHSCASVAVEGFVRNFSVGAAVSALLTLLKNLRRIASNPPVILKLLLSNDNLRIPVFFGLLPFMFHVTRCSLNRAPLCSSELSTFVAGIVSGASMLAYPSVTIAMYTLWKGIEAVYNTLEERGIVPSIPYGDVILYTFSTGYVLWQTVIEPQAIRKGYLNFLDGITGNRIGMFNRDLYEHFGFQSKLLYPNAQPVLNTKYVTLNPMLYQKIMP